MKKKDFFFILVLTIIISLGFQKVYASELYHFDVNMYYEDLLKAENRESSGVLTSAGLKYLKDNAQLFMKANRVYFVRPFQIDGEMFPLLYFQYGNSEEEPLYITIAPVNFSKGNQEAYLSMNWATFGATGDIFTPDRMKFIITYKDEMNQTKTNEIKVKSYQLESTIRNNINVADVPNNLYGSLYLVESENIFQGLKEGDTVIRIDIKPIENVTSLLGSYFRFSTIKIDTEETILERYKRVNEFDELSPEKADELREIVANHMKKIIGIKWTAKNTMNAVKPGTYVEDGITYYNTYDLIAGTQYTGIPYSSGYIWPTLEAFQSVLDEDGYYVGPYNTPIDDSVRKPTSLTKHTLYGFSCTSSTWDAISSALSFAYHAGNYWAVVHNENFQLLGNLVWDSENVNRGSQLLRDNLYQQWKKKCQNVVSFLNQKIISNNTRIWYTYSTDADTEENIYYLAYNNSNNYMPAGEELKVGIANQNIPIHENHSIEISFDFISHEDYDLSANHVKDNMVVNVGLDSSTLSGNGTMVEQMGIVLPRTSVPKTTGGIYRATSVIPISNTLNDVIRTIEIKPYGVGNEGGLFRLLCVRIAVDGEEVLMADATSLMDVMGIYTFQHISNGLLDEETVAHLTSKVVSDNLIAEALANLDVSEDKVASREKYQKIISFLNQKIISNDSRILYTYSTDADTEENIYYLAYNNANSYIPAGEELKVGIANQNISIHENHSIEISFDFISHEDYDLSANYVKDNMIVNVGLASSTLSGNGTTVEQMGIVLPRTSVPKTSGGIYRATSVIPISNTLNDVIRTIEIKPYGVGNEGGLFRLLCVRIAVDGEEVLMADATSLMDVMGVYTFHHISSGVLDEETVACLNCETLSEDLMAEVIANQEMYYAYSQLQKGDIIETSPEGNHTRVITGDTYVAKIEGGTLFSGKQSYVVATDAVPSVGEDGTEMGYIDKKHTFEELNTPLYNNEELSRGIYVPLTILQYSYDVNELKTQLLNANTSDDILSGLKGTIGTNYRIRKVEINIKGETYSGEAISETFEEYPVGREMNYSLYYGNLKESVDDFIDNLKAGEYELTITMMSGPKSSAGEYTFYTFPKLSFTKGLDVNGDGKVNIIDVRQLLQILINHSYNQEEVDRFDFNRDQEFSILDVRNLLQRIINE